MKRMIRLNFMQTIDFEEEEKESKSLIKIFKSTLSEKEKTRFWFSRKNDLITVTITFYAIVLRLTSILHQRSQNRRHLLETHTSSIRIDYDDCSTERQFLHSSSDQTSRFEDSRARVEWYRSNIRAKLCFARWHFRIFILWKCSKQSLNVTSFLWRSMKFLKCHRFKNSLMTMFMRSFEIHFSSEEMNFKSRKNMIWVEYKTNLNIKKFLFVVCLYRVRCSIIKKHWLMLQSFLRIYLRDVSSIIIFLSLNLDIVFR